MVPRHIDDEGYLMKRLTLWLATGFGLGYSPVASGTVGSLPGLLLVWAIYPLPLAAQIATALLLSVLAIPICNVAESVFKTKDDGRVVADEYMTFPLCVLGLPWMMLQYWWLLPMCFVVNRICDIIKPPPANQLQQLKGGLGIVIDDFFASSYALAINHLLFWVAWRFLGL